MWNNQHVEYRMYSPEKLRLIFGLKVKQLRQDKGLSAYILAEQAGLSPSYLNEIEKGKKYPKSEKIFALAKALDSDYDTLVSVKLSKRLEPIGELLNSNILQELPLDLFGLEPADLLELLSEAPTKVSAFVSTLIEISRSHGMNVERFFFSALRSYRQMHDNDFPDIEMAVAQYRQSLHLTDNEPLTDKALQGQLEHTFGYSIDSFTEADQPALARLRSVLLPGDTLPGNESVVNTLPGSLSPGNQPILLFNARLEAEQRAFTFGRELGYRLLNLTNRSLVSSVIEAESFEQVLNNFKASYFAGALLIPRPAIVADLRGLFANPVFDPSAWTDLLTRYGVTPEVLLSRIMNVLVTEFGIGQAFFLRFDTADEQSFTLTKELYLSNLRDPHAARHEHYCRRWPSLTILRELRDIQQRGSWFNKPICQAQRSVFIESKNEYMVITLAKPSPPKPGVNSSVALGILVDDRLRNLFPLLSDSTIARREVNDSCERCRLPDCQERASRPTVWEQHEQQTEMKNTIAHLRARLGELSVS